MAEPRLVPRALEGKLAIVTGSSRGIGAAIASNLAAKGANVVLNYTSPSSQALADDLASVISKEHGVRTLVVQADLSAEGGPKNLVDRVVEAFAVDGKCQVDIIINNAGVAHNNPIPDVTMSDYQLTYATNVLAPLLLLQQLLPHLPTDRSGRIVNISSVSSSTGFVGQSIYGGSKAALEAMTRTWARELSERCTVNAVNPGPVEGPMYEGNSKEFKEGISGWIAHTPLMKVREGDSEQAKGDAARHGGRLATMGEVAGSVGMLCLPEAGWCTGQVVCANGGMIFLH